MFAKMHEKYGLSTVFGSMVALRVGRGMVNTISITTCIGVTKILGSQFIATQLLLPRPQFT
jgi:hypothetical protein